MKKMIAIAVLAAISASAGAAEIYNKDGNKLDLYGKVKGEHDFASHSNADATYARLGFKGETQIADGVTGFGQFEHQFDASSAEGSQTDKTRLAFAGVDLGEAGSVDYGRNYGVVYDIGAYADNLTEFGGDSYQNTDNYMTGRSTGLLTYRNTKLVDGLAFGLQYQGKNEGRAWNKSNGEGVGTSLQYTFGDSGVTLGGAYSVAKATDAAGVTRARAASGENAEAWTVGAKYDANSVYLATTYAETRNLTPVGNYFADKTENLEAMAAYVFDFGLRPSIGYVQSRANVAGVGSEYVAKYIQVGAGYNLNKNFLVDVGYKVNLLDGDAAGFGVNTDDSVVLGATYQF